MPTVSIIIPAYKAQKFIIRAVKSVLIQDIQDWETIIVSDDKFDYRKYLSANGIEDRRFKFLTTNAIASGVANARNIGLDAAKSPMIARLDADDSFDKRKLKIMLPLTYEHGLAISNIRVIDNKTNTEIKHLQYTPNSRIIEYKELLAANCYTNSTFMYKKPNKPIYQPANINYCEDLISISQIFDYYGKAHYSRKKLHNYYLHENSMCNSKDASFNFHRDRSTLISMLKENNVIISNSEIKEMVTTFLNAGIKINELFGSNEFSYKNYVDGLRKFCPFLRDIKNWKKH